MSEATFITTAGNSSLDSCSQALAAHLDVPTLASDVYRGGAERFAGDRVSATALSALAGDLRFIARLRGLRGLVHLPNQHLARYGLLLHEPYVVTVHDLIRYLDLLDGGGLIAAPGRRDAWCLRRDYVGVRRAAAVIAVSEATRRSVVRHLGVPRERVFVVHNGLDHERFRPPAQPIDPGYPYVLFVGSEHPRKNLASVLRALRLLKRASGLRGLKLVKLGAAGRPQAPFRERTRRAIELAGLGEDDVVFCERVADEEMPAWYAGALCLVLPSLHEGFGMPPLEAMACGCPAVISSDPALVEVAGPAALVVNPHDYRALAEAVETLAFDWPLRRRMVQRGLRHAQGFSWPQAAIETHADRDARRMRARGRRSDPRAKPRRQAQRHRRGDTASDARIVERTQPRKYILVGFRSAPNAKLHHQLGMKKQLTVAGDTGARPPEVDGIGLTRDNKPFPSAVTSAVKSRPSRCTSR